MQRPFKKAGEVNGRIAEEYIIFAITKRCLSWLKKNLKAKRYIKVWNQSWMINKNDISEVRIKLASEGFKEELDWFATPHKWKEPNNV